MPAITCPEVQDQIELFALGECDPPTRQAIEAHVPDCPDCAHALEDARRLLGQVDLHYREADALARLRSRLEADGRQRARTVAVLPFLRRAGALAAMLLVAVGLFTWLGLIHPSRPGPPDLMGANVAWAAPQSRWQAVGGRQIRQEAGEIYLKVEGRDARREAADFEVVTPAGVVELAEGEYAIAVRPAADGPGRAPRGKPAVAVTVFQGSARLANAKGVAAAARRETVVAREAEAPKKQVEELALRFAPYYQPVPVRARPRVPPFPLPLDPAKIDNFPEVQKQLGLAADDPLLTRHGFVVLPGRGTDDPLEVYRDLRSRGIPLFITADSVLGLAHVHLDETLRDLEERVLYDDLRALLQGLLAELDRLDLPDAAARAARQKALTYLAVGLGALDPEARVPASADAAAVRAALEEIDKHQGPVEVPFLGRKEDFSRYAPRGHYARNPRLQNYFKAMTWFGRMPLLLNPTSAPSEKGAPAAGSVQTGAAVLLTRALDRARLADGRAARDVWERLYAVTSFFVGLADGLGPPQYRSALAEVGGNWVVPDERQFDALRRGLAKYASPAVLGGNLAPGPTGLAGGPDERAKALGGEAGFRLFGERFVPDSHVLGNLVGPAVGRATGADAFTRARTAEGADVRGFPRGLDLLAVMGNDRARALLRESGDDAYEGYDAALADRRRELDQVTGPDRTRNLYWAWLDALRPLLNEDRGGYPTFMTTRAYQARALNTALAAWALQRHAVVLYARPSETRLEAALEARAKAAAPDAVKPGRTWPPAFVEPLPEVYGRLLALVRMARQGLAGQGVLSDGTRHRLTTLEELVTGLLAAAEKELEGRELDQSDLQFLAGFTDRLAASLTAPDEARVRALHEEFDRAKAAQNQAEVARLGRALGEELAEPQAGPAVADVHADPHSGQVLEVATGAWNLGVFVCREPGGRLLLAAGPVLSYHEFKRAAAERLTPEAWRETLRGPKAPRPPEWTREFLAREPVYAPLK